MPHFPITDTKYEIISLAHNLSFFVCLFSKWVGSATAFSERKQGSQMPSKSRSNIVKFLFKKKSIVSPKLLLDVLEKKNLKNKDIMGKINNERESKYDKEQI